MSRDGASGGCEVAFQLAASFYPHFLKEKLKAFLKIESEVIRFDFWKIPLERE